MNQTQPRTPVVTAGAPSTAVSDQARSVPEYQPSTRQASSTPNPPEPGQPYHAQGWGGKGTDGAAPPRTARAYPATPAPSLATTNELKTQATELPNPVQTAAPQVAPVVQPATTPANTPVSPPTLGMPQATTPAPVNDDRITNLETQVGNMGTLLATISNQLQGIVPNVAQVPNPGTANPLAPQHHAGPAVLGAVPRTEGPVIPKPDPNVNRAEDMNIPRLPNQARMPVLQPGEDALTQAEYIEKHFRARDLSIEQIAWMCHMDDKDVTDVLKELGYQLPEDV
jgi:hypothetical protein